MNVKFSGSYIYITFAVVKFLILKTGSINYDKFLTVFFLILLIFKLNYCYPTHCLYFIALLGTFEWLNTNRNYGYTVKAVNIT